MERVRNTFLNGHRRAIVLEKEVVTNTNTLEKVIKAKTAVLMPDQKTAPVVTPDADLQKEEPTLLPPQEEQKDSTPKRKRPIGLVLAV